LPPQRNKKRQPIWMKAALCGMISASTDPLFPGCFSMRRQGKGLKKGGKNEHKDL